MAALKVAYLLLYFPRLTETFVAEEIRCMRSQGVDVQIVSLLKPASEPVQAVSEALLEFTWYAPGLTNARVWAAQLHFLVNVPRRYFSLLLELMGQPLRGNRVSLLLKRLVIFLKAVTAAYYLESQEIQLVHAHFAWLAGGAAWVCARLLNLPFTATVHAYDVFSQKNDLLSLVGREARHVIAISEANRSAVAAVEGLSAVSISVIHCGVDCARFQDHSGGRRAGMTDAKLRILSVGSLVVKKGHRHLVEACDELRKRGIDFTCTIIGGGPEESALLEQIQACDLEDRVTLAGPLLQGEVIAAYLKHDVFVLGATVAADGDKDGIPVVLMEAGAMGLPVISTPVSGIPELVRHEETGLLVAPGDSAGLAEAIATLAGDPARRTRLGRNTRALVQAEFNVESSAEELAGLFRDTIRHWTFAQVGEAADHATERLAGAPALPDDIKDDLGSRSVQDGYRQ